MPLIPPTVVPSGVPPQPKKMPKGAHRDPSAMCYILAPQMRLDILDGSKEKLQATSAYMRDGSIPLVQPLGEGQDDPYLPAQQGPVDRSFVHINEPRAGVALPTSFQFHFINPTVFDKTARVLLRNVEDGAETVILEKTEMDGNHIKQTVERPEELKGGDYGEPRR